MKNSFKKLRIKFCLMRTIIMNKIETQKSLEVKRTNQYRDTKWNMRFYFIIQRMAFDLSTNKQSKWPHSKILLVHVYEIAKS